MAVGLRDCGDRFEFVLEPILVTTSIPVAEIHLGEGVWQRDRALELTDDDTIRQAVLDHAVDEVPGCLGQAGNFAITRMAVPAEGGSDAFEQVGEIWWCGGIHKEGAALWFEAAKGCCFRQVGGRNMKRET